VHARLTAGPWWPAAGPPGGLAGWGKPVGWLGFGPLGQDNIENLFFFFQILYKFQINLNSNQI
jgi:hypothetical protein